MLRLLMLHPHDIRYFPWTIRIVKFAEILAKRGHEVTLVHPEIRWQELSSFPKGPVFQVPDDAPYRVVRLGERYVHMARNLRTVIGLAGKADLIHVQKCFASVALPALIASRKWDLPLHYDWDDYEEAIIRSVADNTPRAFPTLTRFYERRLYRYADTISVSSEGIRQLALGRGFPGDRIFPAPVGADLEMYQTNLDGSFVRRQGPRPIGSAPLVLYLGQLEGAAYAELVLKAASLVRERVPGVRFMVLGGGHFLKPLRRQASGLGLDSTVDLPGYAPRHLVPYYVAAADVAVGCFEDNEITRCKSPLKIAEYMAAGKAIVASRVGEVTTMLGDCGILTGPGDAASLAEGIERFLQDPELRRIHGERARQRSENMYNWAWSVDHLERAYALATGTDPGVHRE
jgi:glycosyltransferase involved in cell wall biosynthesis